jgi:hypothetical protein
MPRFDMHYGLSHRVSGRIRIAISFGSEVVRSVVRATLKRVAVCIPIYYGLEETEERRELHT